MGHVVDQVALQSVEALCLSQAIGCIEREEQQHDHQQQVDQQLHPHVRGQQTLFLREEDCVKLHLLQRLCVSGGNAVAFILKRLQQIDIGIPEKNRAAIAIEQCGSKRKVHTTVLQHRGQEAVRKVHGNFSVHHNLGSNLRQTVGPKAGRRGKSAFCRRRKLNPRQSEDRLDLHQSGPGLVIEQCAPCLDQRANRAKLHRH